MYVLEHLREDELGEVVSQLLPLLGGLRFVEEVVEGGEILFGTTWLGDIMPIL